jgi:predicted Zn-dependent protease
VAARGLTAVWCQAEVVREDLAVVSSQGLEVRWRATEARLRALVADGGQRRQIEVSARRRADLDAARAVAAVARRLKAMAGADVTPAGTWSVVLGPDALLAGGDLGMLAAFAAQVDAGVERQGLTRYRSGQPVAEGAAAAADPLTLISDGTLAFGPRSAPIADDGEPVRRFTLVDRGTASGLALDHREAALRGESPNGGVRNLVVSAGSGGRDELLAAPVLELEEVAWIDLDARTGDLSAAIGLATVHDARGSRAVSGGVMRIDAIAALALARRSAAVVRRGAYVGPAQWRLTAEIG